MRQRIVSVLAAVTSALSLSGCQDVAQRAIVWLFYQEARLPAERVHKDLAYWTGVDAHPRKHRLDLYLPKGADWPVLLFVHGGSWSSGDKALVFGGADPYANIGRFYASRGIGVAVVNYRLQPTVTWKQQVEDITRALAWVHGNVHRYGGNPDAVFLFGHSAGAHLATRAALDGEQLERHGIPPESVCGVISVSGTPFDLTDPETYELGMDPEFLERYFRTGDNDDAWKTKASSVGLVRPSAPPFLLLHGRWEWKSLHRQNELMRRSLAAAGVPNERIITPWDQHFLIVGSLSHPDRLASSAVLDFISRTACNVATTQSQEFSGKAF